MATSAFKSTSRRSQIFTPEKSSPSAKTTEDASSSNRPGFHRRSRSLSRFPGRYSGELQESKGRRFVNTERGSDFAAISLEDIAAELFRADEGLERGDREEIGGGFVRGSRGLERGERGDFVGLDRDERGGIGIVETVEKKESVGFERGERKGIGGLERGGRDGSRGRVSRRAPSMGPAERRGRSVSRHVEPTVNPKGNGDGVGRRLRSVSVARYQYSDSESDKDHINCLNRLKSNNSASGDAHRASLHMLKPNGTLPSDQRGLRRSMSQKDLLQSHDDYSSYSSALTDDEGPDVRCSRNGSEKTIRAVYAQKKTEHPTGDEVGTGLYEAMRKEVRNVVAQIRTELEQVMSKTNGNGLQSKTTDISQAITLIRKNYTTKLEESEKRTKDLLAELAVEERRGRELSKVVRGLLPDYSKQSEPEKPARTRKRSMDRNKMSKRLTEEAEKYFEGFLSNVEDTEFSSFDDEKSDGTLSGNPRPRDLVLDTKNGDSQDHTVSPLETDGVVLPWLQWETSNDGSSLFRDKMEIPPSSRKNVSDVAQEWSPCIESADSKSNMLSSCHGSWSPGSDTHDWSTKSLTSNSHVNNLESGTPENYQKFSVERGKLKKAFELDEYLHHRQGEDLLMDRLRYRQRIQSGALIICCNSFI
ncbi:hypothetical protein AMTRI_Chr10g8270 [Amborella trichopoda]